MKKRKGAPLKPKTVLTIIAVCAGICLAGIGYIWAKTEVHQLSRQIKALEIRRDALKKENNALEREYASMCTPAVLDQRVKRMNMGLVSPNPEQIIRLPEPQIEKDEEMKYAARPEERRY